MNDMSIVQLHKIPFFIDVSGNDDEVNDDNKIFIINKYFGGCLSKLQREACYYQYQLAYLSTMGGAYFLCENPRVALVIAKKQEFVGSKLGASSIIMRSRVYQAVNYALLGKQNRSKRYFLGKLNFLYSCRPFFHVKQM